MTKPPQTKREESGASHWRPKLGPSMPIKKERGLWAPSALANSLCTHCSITSSGFMDNSSQPCTLTPMLSCTFPNEAHA
eukprot:1151022-Pelagomonas_calceolata.AAC.3